MTPRQGLLGMSRSAATARARASIPTKAASFTCLEFIEKLKSDAIAISMDGMGVWRDDVFMECVACAPRASS